MEHLRTTRRRRPHHRSWACSEVSGAADRASIYFGLTTCARPTQSWGAGSSNLGALPINSRGLPQRVDWAGEEEGSQADCVVEAVTEYGGP